jgi:hypothetical protein
MRIGRGFVFRGRAMVLVGLMLLGTAVAPMAASAHFIGNSWPYSGPGLLALSYQNNAGAFPAYANAVNQGASNWFATPTPSDLYSVSGSANITINTVYDTTLSYWGITHIYANQQVCLGFFGCIWWPGRDFPFGAYTTPTSVSGWSNYQYSTITLVRNTLDAETDFTKVKVATHEFGHAQGLAHAYSPNCTSVMQQGYLSKTIWNGFMWVSVPFNTPQAHDSYDFDQLYAGSGWSAAYAC